MAIYLKLKYGDFLLIDIVYENGPIKFFCISAVLMLDVSIDTGLATKKQATEVFFLSCVKKKIDECWSARGKRRFGPGNASGVQRSARIYVVGYTREKTEKSVREESK